MGDSQLHSILSRYPANLVRIVGSPDPSKDLGEFLPHIGRVQRFFKPKDPDYFDHDVAEYILSTGDDPQKYSLYKVAPRTVELSTKSIKRFNKFPKYTNDDAYRSLAIASSWYTQEFSKFMFDSPMLSVGEAIENFQPRKSAGYPLTVQYPYKEDWYGSEQGEEFWDTYWSCLHTDDYIRSLCSVAVKEEVRSSEKLNLGKVRTTISYDTNHTLALSMMTLTSSRRLIFSHNQHSSALGMSHFNGGWHQLQDIHMRWFRETGIPDSIALDGVEFDGQFKWCEMLECARFDYSCLPQSEQTPDNWKRLYNLCYEVIHAPIVNVNGDVFRRNIGNASGQACTTRHNNQKSYMNIAQLYILACWMRNRLLKHGPRDDAPAIEHAIYADMTADKDRVDYLSYKHFSNLVIKRINGDDVNVTVHPSIHSWFNIDVIKHLAPMIGMQYTFESDKFERFVDLSFLGHRFELVDIPSLGYAMYLPVIDCDKMRHNMLIFNDDQTISKTIIRACGLRNETFACESCRTWFSNLIAFLRVKYSTDMSPDVVEAWKNYLTDSELWTLFTGKNPESVPQDVHVCAPDKLYHTQSYITQFSYPPILRVSVPEMTKTKSQRARAKAAKLATAIVPIAAVKSAVKAAVQSSEKRIIKHEKQSHTHKKPSSHSSVSRIVATKNSEDVRVAHSWMRALESPFYNTAPMMGSSASSLRITSLTLDLNMNSTGCLGLLMMPRTMLAASYANSDSFTGSGTYAGTWNAVSMVGEGSMTSSDVTAVRLLAAGIRWSVTQAETAAPGYVAGGLYPSPTNVTMLTLVNPNSFFGFKSTIQSVDPSKSKVGSINWVPLDNLDGSFTAGVVGNSTYLSTNVPYVVFTGWPAGTAVRAQWIMQWEVLVNPTGGSASLMNTGYGGHDYSTIRDVLYELGGKVLQCALKLGATRIANTLIQGLGSVGHTASSIHHTSQGSEDEQSFWDQWFKSEGGDYSHDELRGMHETYRGLLATHGVIATVLTECYSEQGLASLVDPVNEHRRIAALERELCLVMSKLKSLEQKRRYSIGETESIEDLSTLDVSKLPTADSSSSSLSSRIGKMAGVVRRSATSK